MDWIKTLNTALEFIEENLEEDITSHEIASHVALSSFHFQRAFSLMTDMTVKEYVRSRRLSQAGMELVSQKAKVIDVALKYGYETPESFTRAFRRFHGILPSQAVKDGVNLKSFSPLTVSIILKGGKQMEYKIEKKEAMELVALVRSFDQETSSVKIPEFWTEYYANGDGDKVPGMMGICLSGPGGSDQYAIGCPREYAKEIPEEFEILHVPSYTWAMFKSVGAMPYAIQNLWDQIYKEWLPTADYNLISDYDIEFYPDGDNSKDDYISYIWFPVSKKI